MAEEWQPEEEKAPENEAFFCRFTFGQFFAILLLEVFTLFFVFYLGARYGQEFLGLSALKANQEENITSPSKLQTTTDPAVTEMAQELIQKAKTPELKERIAAMLGTDLSGKPLPPSEPVATEPSDENVQDVEDEFVEAPAQEAQPVPTAPVRVTSSPAGRYSIQVGSFPKLEEANAEVDRWKARGYDAFMMIADIPDRGRWYRIRIGAFGSRPEATTYMQEFSDREKIDALVVLNEE